MSYALLSLLALAGALPPIRPARRNLLTRPVFAAYRKLLPQMSDTEREALAAGSFWHAGDRFRARQHPLRALACRYLLVVDEPGTKLGLPEVMLGIFPGWGGMLRLPRRIGPAAAETAQRPVQVRRRPWSAQAGRAEGAAGVLSGPLRDHRHLAEAWRQCAGGA